MDIQERSISMLSISNVRLNENDGSGYIILNNVKKLREKGISIDLVGPDELGYFGRLRRAKRYGLAIGMAVLVIKKLIRNKFDLIEYWGGEGWFAIILVKSFFPNIKQILHSNGIENHAEKIFEEYRSHGLNPVPKRWYHFSQSSLFKIAYGHVNLIIVPAIFDKNYLITYEGLTAEKIQVINNSLQKCFLGQRIKSNKRNVLLYCGGASSNKNPSLVLKDVESFLIENEDWYLIIAGPGTDSSWVNLFCSKIRKQVSCLGFISRAELFEVYKTASILLVPSFYESFGLVVAEALASQCVVISSPVGLACDLAHGEQIYQLKSPTTPYLLEALRELANSPDLLEKMRSLGYKYIQKLNWDAAIEAKLKLYRNLT